MSQNQVRKFYEVAVNVPLSKTFTYHFDSEFDLSPGTLTKAPFGSRKINAVVLRKCEKPNDFATKSLLLNENRADTPQISDISLQWAKWLSEYYVYPLGQTLNHFLPSLKRKANRIENTKTELNLETALPLTDEQSQVVKKISPQLKNFNIHLLYGITGSGKTEIYLQLIDEVIKNGQQALVLVPEISLTPQLEDRFKKRFGESKIAVIHSQITPRNKTNAWYDITDNKKPILIGARSALFTNFNNLGIIIVDEEHDTSFKQDEKLKYNGKDAAIMLAKFSNCPIILGSATPSLETWNQAKNGKYHLHALKQRVFKQSMPQAKILDLRNAEAFIKNEFWYTEVLHEKITDHLERGNQVALFLNRRGLAQTIQCLECGNKIDCPDCDISLTLHLKKDLLCHYCGYHEKRPETCPECSSDKLVNIGLGTEKLENTLQEVFPDRKIIRADRDSIANRNDMQNFISQVEAQEVDILIGTQMIAKGLDFPKLSFVGIVLADVGLNIPDFRASERIFQLITQVSGRAGRRKDLQGEVLIQSFNPEHPVFPKAINHSFSDFAHNELEERQIFQYPPFIKTACLRVQAPSTQNCIQACKWVESKTQGLVQKHTIYKGIEILGPTPAPIQKIKNQHRYLFLLKSSENLLIQKFFSQLTHSTDGLPAKTKLSLDVDPINML